MTGENKYPFENWQMEAFVGDNTAYYKKKWGKYPEYLGWNWAAFFLGACWAVYRKMYKEAAIVFAIVAIIYIVFPKLEVNTGPMLGWIFAIWGNSFYHKKLVKIVKTSEELRRDEQKILLKKKGGTNPVAVIVLIVLQIIAFFIL